MVEAGEEAGTGEEAREKRSGSFGRVRSLGTKDGVGGTCRGNREERGVGVRVGELGL